MLNKLGNDLFLGDNILNGVTFEELVTTIRCNDEFVCQGTVMREFNSILEKEIADARYLVERNVNEIIAAVEKLRQDGAKDSDMGDNS